MTKKIAATASALAVLGALFLFGGAPPVAAAEQHEVTFEAPLSCTVVCAYWVEQCIGCNEESLTRKTLRDLGHDEPVADTNAAVETCDKPFPPGSFDEVAVGTPPADAKGLFFKLIPAVDWDGFICVFRGPNQDELRANPRDTAERWRLSAQAANSTGDPCDNALGIPEAAVGCAESATTAVTQGLEYKLIAYNWSDVPTADGLWNWVCEAECAAAAAEVPAQQPAGNDGGEKQPGGSGGGDTSPPESDEGSGEPSGSQSSDAPPARSPSYVPPSDPVDTTTSAEEPVTEVQNATEERQTPRGEEPADETSLAAARAASDARDLGMGGLIKTIAIVIGVWALIGAAAGGAWYGWRRVRA